VIPAKKCFVSKEDPVLESRLNTFLPNQAYTCQVDEVPHRVEQGKDGPIACLLGQSGDEG
jgi:hypothetical protein